jgi:cell division protease FtsH
VATLATTNHADKLDWALIDRPGRFDCRIELGYPNATIRKAIVKKYLQPLPHKDDLDLTYVVRKTEQMSGAYLEELIRLAFQNALSLVDYQADKATITNADLEYATELLLKQRGRTIKDMERNNLALPDMDEDEDEEYYEDFYQ